MLLLNDEKLDSIFSNNTFMKAEQNYKVSLVVEKIHFSILENRTNA